MENEKPNQSFWHNFFLILWPFLVFLSFKVLAQASRLPHEISFFDFWIMIFATFRLIRLFVYDSITEHIRLYLGKYNFGVRKELSDLISCPWCTGIWMALLVSFFFFLSPFYWYPIFILALAGLGSIVQIIILKIGKL